MIAEMKIRREIPFDEVMCKVVMVSIYQVRSGGFRVMACIVDAMSVGIYELV